MLRNEMEMWVIEMVSCVSKGVNFEFGEEILRDFLEEPVQDHSTLDPTLRMQNEHHFGQFVVVELSLHNDVAVADILCGVVEVTLD